jgi:hypothetical protein
MCSLPNVKEYYMRTLFNGSTEIEKGGTNSVYSRTIGIDD